MRRRSSTLRTCFRVDAVWARGYARVSIAIHIRLVSQSKIVFNASLSKIKTEICYIEELDWGKKAVSALRHVNILENEVTGSRMNNAGHTALTANVVLDDVKIETMKESIEKGADIRRKRRSSSSSSSSTGWAYPAN